MRGQSQLGWAGLRFHDALARICNNDKHDEKYESQTVTFSGTLKCLAPLAGAGSPRTPLIFFWFWFFDRPVLLDWLDDGAR